MVEFNPIVVPVPVINLVKAIRIPLSSGVVIESARLLRVDGYLAQLTSGPFTVEVRDLKDDTLITTLTWNAVGLSTSGAIDYPMTDASSGLTVQPGLLGSGAQSCILTIWVRMEN